MPIVNSAGFAHVRLTVTDVKRSKEFYDQVFGWKSGIDESENVQDPKEHGNPGNFYGGIVYQTPQGTLFGLRPVGNETFESTRTGLDHVSFSVDSREDLEAAAKAMDEAGITRGEINDLTDAGIAILSFQDPDDINIELTAPLG